MELKLDQFIELPKKCGCSCHNFNEQSICCSCDCDLDILIANPPNCLTPEMLITSTMKGEDKLDC